jgi:hypothetical protein
MVIGGRFRELPIVNVVADEVDFVCEQDDGDER